MTPTMQPGPRTARPRRLRLAAVDGRRPVDRDDAVRRVRDARRQLQPRHERFAYLRRVPD